MPKKKISKNWYVIVGGDNEPVVSQNDGCLTRPIIFEDKNDALNRLKEKDLVDQGYNVKKCDISYEL